jgi:tripartite ATP-independent transporter DctP family solute receptor
MQTIGRRSILGFATGTALALPALRRANAAAEFRLRAATGLAPDHPTNVRLKEAATLINQKSGGKVQIDVFPNSQLGGEADLLNQVRSGAVDIYMIGGLVISSIVPMAALDGTGYAFQGYDQVWPAMDGKLGAFIRDAIMSGSGLYVTSKIWDLGFREITNSQRPIVTDADLNGMKLRVPYGDAYTTLFKALGASPATIQFPEVYSALQTKIIDGQENPVSLIATSKFYEVQKYCSMTNHMWNGFWVLFNRRSWQRLPQDLHHIVEEELNAGGVRQRSDLAAQQQNYIDTIKKGGVTFNTPDPASFRAQLKNAGYYADARKRFGDKAWQLLEEASGDALG